MEDVKEVLRWCLDIPNRTLKFEYEKTKISKRFYGEASLLSLSLSSDVLGVSQMGYRPDQAAITIIQREEIIQRKIDRLNEIYRLFLECIDDIKVNDLKELISLSSTSKIERRAYRELQEVRSYMFFKYYGTEFDQEDYTSSDELLSLTDDLDDLIRGAM